MNGTPIVRARGLLAPTRCFCNELNAIMDTVTRETTEKPRMAVRSNANRSKRKMACDPAIAPEVITAMDSAMKSNSAKERAAFKYCLKTSL